MTEIIFGVVIMMLFIGMFYTMKYIDDFFHSNYKTIIPDDENEPFCVILSEDMTDEELIKEIRNFQDKHESMEILVYEDSDKIRKKILSTIEEK